MRVLVMVKANKDSEAGVLPSKEILTEMGKFNEELVKAGIMLAAEGLQSSLSLAEGPLLRVAYFDLGRRAPGRSCTWVSWEACTLPGGAGPGSWRHGWRGHASTMRQNASGSRVDWRPRSG